MIYSLRGVVVHRDTQSMAVECGGVAYHCLCTRSTIADAPLEGEEILLYTHMNYRQDSVDLFGFLDKPELDTFRMLISVTGVGAKVALSVLSTLTPERFALSISAEDIDSLTQAPGVGKKLAQRMVLELKDKVGAADFSGGTAIRPRGGLGFGTGNAAEAIEALVVLGYSQGEAAAAVSQMDSALPVDEMVKAGLKALAGKI